MKKIKYLFLMIFTMFISISFVNAEKQVTNLTYTDVTPLAISCSNNLLKMELSNTVMLNSNYIFTYETIELENSNSQYVANKYLIEVKENTKYYFYSTNTSYFTIYYLKESLQFISSSSLVTQNTITTPSNTKYILLVSNQKYNTFKTSIENDKFMLSQSDTQLDYVDYLDCSAIPEEPETPTPDSTLDDFYNLFNSKLKLIASSTLENKFMFSVIGIVVLFTVLGLFFKIFRIGGK